MGAAKHGKVSSKVAEKPKLSHCSSGSNPQPPDSPKTPSLGKRSRNKSMRRKEDSAGREEAHAQQLPKPACPRAHAVNRRSPGDGKPEHCNSRVAPTHCNKRKALTATKTQCSQKQINKYKLFWKKKKRGPAIGRRHKGAPLTLCIQWRISKMSANFTNFRKKKGLQ